jgi:hypothetical protein
MASGSEIFWTALSEGLVGLELRGRKRLVLQLFRGTPRAARGIDGRRPASARLKRWKGLTDERHALGHSSEAAAIVVKAVSEIVEATKVINGDLESYMRLVLSGSGPIRRQPAPVTLVETLAPTPTRLPVSPPLPELRSVPLFQAQRPNFCYGARGQPT